jgi:uncharacterized membrane protein
MWNFWGMGWGMWFWLLLFIGVGYLIYVSSRPIFSQGRSVDPLKVARLRLAKGEITLEQFERIRDTLKK